MHKHHIMPKHLGGTNDPDNLVEVSVEEHARIHHSQWILGDRPQDYLAWKCLSGQIDKYEINRLRAKLPKSEAHKQALRKPHKKLSNETKEKMRLAHLGKSSGMKGKKAAWLTERNKKQGPWNKGLTKADARVAKNVALMAATRYGGR